jgi:molybdate transport system substrate-binding protein
MNRRILPALVAVLLLVAGCGSSSAPRSTTTPAAGGASAVTGTVTVFAAASLTESFTTLAGKFEAAHPGVHVKLNFGASSALALQITQGAPADVFASASAKNMTQVVDAKAASDPKTFARNVMEIAVPPANPARVTGVADLARSGVKVALCQSQVPCGATAAKVFDKAGVTVKPVTLEPDVKAALTKVQTDEVDAAVVYVTDVRAAGAKVRGIEIPDAQNASTDYPIAVLAKAGNPTGGQAFADFVLSATGRDVLAAAGFAAP